MVAESSGSGEETSARPALERGDAALAAIRVSEIRTPAELAPLAESLRKLLQSCVNPEPASSSIGFRAPLSDADADAFWASVAKKLAPPPATPDNDRPEKQGLYLFVITSPPPSTAGIRDAVGREVLATAQLVPIPKVTHRHRAEVVKVLVHPDAQRRGLGRALMEHVEVFARRRLGREVLTLDTASVTPARHFYAATGWEEWGTCPAYADFADGSRADATFFVKMLGPKEG